MTTTPETPTAIVLPDAAAAWQLTDAIREAFGLDCRAVPTGLGDLRLVIRGTLDTDYLLDLYRFASEQLTGPSPTP
jgi:hypothetical protein